ncbi:PR domain zinc finger protein 5-like [Diabrotica virgifera virgifera]|uniref:PR domain zinc finger protein 5-like n=2 Tax=Diabrotica virgifera virgifera TaxID=50390 RepID=A0A6P7GJX4_DIAVI|nr:PR domain zinc finger protein 5-like [Diabrotica virgifera virgifera]
MAPRKKRNNRKKKSLDENKNENVTISKNLSQKYNTEKLNVICDEIKVTEDVKKVNINKTDKNFVEDSNAVQKSVLYSCQLCYKIFSLEREYINHKEKCSNSNFHIISNVRINGTSETVTETIPVQDDSTNVSPNGNSLYPCRNCSIVFPSENTCKSHMNQCKKNNLRDKELINIRTKESDNPRCQSPYTGSEKLSDVSRTTEISEEPMPKQPKYDISIYDYDEIDSEDDTPKVPSDTKCKYCEFIADNPMELLKHKRELHTAAKQTLPVHEIQKYFDYPDRSFCPICEQPVKTKNFRSIFIRHLLVHAPSMSFQCRICKKRFRRLDHMKAHEKRHVLTYAELQALQENVNNDKPTEDILIDE